MNGYISIKNWHEFQHYRDRNPPWIKLHRDLLRDYEFSCLQDASKLLLIELWLLASQKQNKIPADPKWLKRQLPFDGKIDLKPLIDSGFITVEQDASEVLAERKQSARLETEAETEAETERDAPKKRKTSLPEDWQLPDDYRAYCVEKRPELKPDDVADNFKDYYIGEGKRMMDWKRTWQRWVRNERSRKASNGTGEPVISTPQSRNKAAAEKYFREQEGNGTPVAADDGTIR